LQVFVYLSMYLTNFERLFFCFQTQYYDNVVYINYTDFLFLFDEAVDKWVDSYNGSNKQLTFIERYDEVVRDNY
ncbi:hypothetical protein PJ027_17515, partial [Escherichia coli]|nr:hypothetical protein [Escherichia coli]